MGAVLCGRWSQGRFGPFYQEALGRGLGHTHSPLAPEPGDWGTAVPCWLSGRGAGGKGGQGRCHGILEVPFKVTDTKHAEV